MVQYSNLNSRMDTKNYSNNRTSLIGKMAVIMIIAMFITGISNAQTKQDTLQWQQEMPKVLEQWQQEMPKVLEQWQQEMPKVLEQ